MVRHPVSLSIHADRGQNIIGAAFCFFRRHSGIERPERHILVHRRHEQLVAGILKHKSDSAAYIFQRLVADLESSCGVSVSVRTIYAIERGEQLPRLDLLLALLVVLDEALDSFYPAISDDIGDKLKRRGTR